MTLTNIIFLDFDGVIVNPETCVAEGERGGYSYFDPISTRLVKRLCEENNCRIVVSSSWRLLYNDSVVMQTLLSAVCPNLGNYMYQDSRWRTKSLATQRGEEILQWTKDYEGTFDKFVILDDDSDMNPFMDRLVHTNPYQGFRMKDFIKAKELLREEIW
jgi:hypothetical protein